MANHISDQTKTWIEEAHCFTFREASLPRNCRFPTAMDFYKVNVYFVSFDYVVSELESRFSENDQDILCALSEIVLTEKPNPKSFDVVAEHYAIDKDVLSA